MHALKRLKMSSSLSWGSSNPRKPRRFLSAFRPLCLPAQPICDDLCHLLYDIQTFARLAKSWWKWSCWIWVQVGSLQMSLQKKVISDDMHARNIW